MAFLLAVLAVRWSWWDLGLRRPSFEIPGEECGRCADFDDFSWMVFLVVSIFLRYEFGPQNRVVSTS